MKSFVEGVPFSDKNVPAGNLMRKLPSGLFRAYRDLSEGGLREAVGDLLDGREIRAVLSRRELSCLEIGKVVERFGEADVLY